MSTDTAIAGPDADVSGPLRFARYAYPPNALGYCGPDDHLALVEHVAAGAADDGLRRLARGFEGAWPYLRLIAAANGISDELDPRVVEAYWIGNRLLDRVPPALFASFLDDTFGRRLRGARSDLVVAPYLGAMPHHSFHVFCVYPWIGLLRGGRTDEPMRVLDGCRVRWGTLDSVHGDTGLVRSKTLAWTDPLLTFGAERIELVTLRTAGKSLAGEVRAGELVSMHWDWVCDRLTRRHAEALERYTARTLAVANALTPRPMSAFG